MAWVTLPGLAGKVYVPDDTGRQPKKHPCSTCYACQWCDENRCQVCRDGGSEHAGNGSRPCCNSNQTLYPSNPKSQAPNNK